MLVRVFLVSSWRWVRAEFINDASDKFTEFIFLLIAKHVEIENLQNAESVYYQKKNEPLFLTFVAGAP